MKIIRRRFVLFVLLLLLAGGAFGDIPAGYYDGTAGLTDQALILKLRQITGNGYISHSYDDAKAEIYSTIDLQQDGLITGIYTGNEHPASELNIEHAWPQSRGADVVPRESDCHHLFPCEPDINNRRGNLPYGWVTNPDYEINGSKVEYNVEFEPRDAVKGDIARAIFYFAMRYDYPLVNTGYVLGSSEDKMGFEDVLRQWNTQDPPDDAERARNDRIYAYQHNRNPFVDHPEFVDQIASFGGQATATPTPTGTAGPSPTATPTGTTYFDLSGYMVKQFNSIQSYTFPGGTYIQAGEYLVLARQTDRAGIEAAWSTTLASNVVVVNSNDTCPMINGGESYELIDPQGAVVDGETATSGMNATSGRAALRAGTDSTSWALVEAGAAAAPGADSFATHNAGVVIVKFGEPPSGYIAEYVELYYDAEQIQSPTPTATATATATPSPTALVGTGAGWMLF